MSFFSRVLGICKLKTLNLEGITCFSWPLVTKPSDFVSDNMMAVGTSTGHVYYVAITVKQRDLNDIDDDDESVSEEPGFEFVETCVIYKEDGKRQHLVICYFAILYNDSLFSFHKNCYQ